MAWVFLAMAIVFEVTATLSLRAAEGFAKLGPTVIVVCGYVVAFWSLGQCLQRGMSLGVAYGIWCGIGIALVAVLGKLLFDDGLSRVTVLGIVLIILGCVVVQLGGTERSTV
jgi:small multidrug resistance pump